MTQHRPSFAALAVGIGLIALGRSLGAAAGGARSAFAPPRHPRPARKPITFNWAQALQIEAARRASHGN